MTQLEQELAALGKLALRQYIRKDEIDWEQRRYEIARDVYANQFHGNLTAEKAVKKADELIKILKTR